MLEDRGEVLLKSIAVTEEKAKQATDQRLL